MAGLVEEEDGLSPDSTQQSDGDGIPEEEVPVGTSLAEEEEILPCQGGDELANEVEQIHIR